MGGGGGGFWVGLGWVGLGCEAPRRKGTGDLDLPIAISSLLSLRDHHTLPFHIRTLRPVTVMLMPL